MATRNSNKARGGSPRKGSVRKERWPAPNSRRTPNTRPTPPSASTKAGESLDRCDGPFGDVLERLSRSISLVETIAVAMQTHEDDPVLGSIAETLDLACCQLRGVHGAVDLALKEVAS